MSDNILIDGDVVVFVPDFKPALVMVLPGKLAASGPATIGGKKICVDGDESKVEVAGCKYMTPQYSMLGSGTLKIASLGGDQKATKTKTGGKAVLLKGSKFVAKFEVQVPAMQPLPAPASPLPDTMLQYTGQGSFIAANFKFTGS